MTTELQMEMQCLDLSLRERKSYAFAVFIMGPTHWRAGNAKRGCFTVRHFISHYALHFLFFSRSFPH